MLKLAPALALAAVLAVVVTLIVGPPTAASRPLIVVPFACVGGLLATRRRENPIGWLFLAFGVLGAITFAAESYAEQALVRAPGSLGGGDVAAAIAAHLWHAGFGFLVFAFLLFPNGHLLSARWRWVAGAALVVYGGLLLSGPFDGTYLREDVPRAHPLVHGAAEHIGSAVFSTLLPINLLVLLLAAVSLILRLRRSAGDERQQVKWFITPVAFVMVAFPLSVVAASDGRYGVWLFPLIPASAAVAILRYRLYDIDVVINRALVYGALTGTLAATYLGAVLLLELVLPAESGLAVAASTLAAAAVFRPARARIQALVDRRFFRTRYDAELTLASFGSRLRDEVDLSKLGTELQVAVAETMHPSHVSLWLRERA